MKKINKEGFTLIELLLVIAIIGILAAGLMFGLGSQRSKANFSNVLKAASGVNAYVADCYMRGVALNSPAAAAAITAGTAETATANTAICAGAGAVWPDADMGTGLGAGTLECRYVGVDATSTTAQYFRIACDTNGNGTNAPAAGTGDATITCTGSTGACVQGTY